MGLKLKWDRWDLNSGAFRYTCDVAGLRAVVGDDEDGGFFWLIRDRMPRIDGTLPTVEAAQEAAEAALARLLAEDEGLLALYDHSACRALKLLGAHEGETLPHAAGFVARERDELRARVAELEAAARWIPVGEQMPEEGATVLVYSASRGVMVATYQMDIVGPAFFGHGYAPRSVTHWRPLPAGPEVEK